MAGPGLAVRGVGGAQCAGLVVIRGVICRHRGSESGRAPRGGVGHPPSPGPAIRA